MATEGGDQCDKPCPFGFQWSNELGGGGGGGGGVALCAKSAYL